MFAALNNFISRLDAEPSQNTESVPHGFQVVRNSDPELQLEPWYDFICGINGRQLDDPNSQLFTQEVRNCAGTSVALTVWCAKGQALRMLRLPISAEKPDLGLSLQWSPITLTEQVWHILDVTANSPADKAGLLPYSDYVIGSPAGVMRGESGLPELIEHHIDRPLPLYIYNHESDVTRPLTITPSRTWGGVGALGCVLGYGALHRLPQPLTAGPAPDPGETFFDHNAGDVQQPIDPIGDSGTFVPASELFGAAPAPSESPEVPHPERNSDSPVPVRTSKPKRAQPKAIVPALDDYFDEGEKESKQLDYALGPKPAADGIAPPPKRGT